MTTDFVLSIDFLAAVLTLAYIGRLLLESNGSSSNDSMSFRSLLNGGTDLRNSEKRSLRNQIISARC